MQIIKKIGHGVFGTTYKVKVNNKFYAFKIQKILPNEKDESTLSKIWREIYFAKQMNQYPNSFMNLHSYNFIDDCKHKQAKPDFKLAPKFQKHVDKYNKSKYCVTFLYDLKDGVIKDIINELSTQQIYSFTAQMLYIIYLLNKHEFGHFDIHSANIAYVKTNKETIKLGNITVKTFGWIFSLIDYGEVLTESFKLNKYDKIKLVSHKIMNFDLDCLLRNILMNGPNNAWNDILLNQPKKVTQWKKYKKLLVKRPEYDVLLDIAGKDAEIEVIALYMEILYPKESLLMSGLDSTIVDDYLDFLISVGDMLYIMNNRYDLMHCVEYFSDKANNLQIKNI